MKVFGNLILLLVIGFVALMGVAEAQDKCVCELLLAPVCGKDGKDYDNECLAKCAGTEKAKDGKCQDACVCGYILLPVCGKDGKDYDNECLAKCAGTEKAKDGKC